MKNTTLSRFAPLLFAITFSWLAFQPTILHSQLFSAPEVVKSSAYLPYDAAAPGSVVPVAVKVAIKDKFHVNSNKPTKLEWAELIPTVLELEVPDGLTAGAVRYPEAVKEKIEFAQKDLAIYKGTFYICTSVEIGEKIAAGKELPLKASLSYQACDSTFCYPPKTIEMPLTLKIADKDRKPGLINRDVFITSGCEAPAEKKSAVADEEAISGAGRIGKAFTEGRFLLAFASIFLVGLALNLTPCVYPIIPITIAFFGGQSEGKVSRNLLLGLFYMLGIAITYSVLGVAAAMTGALFGSWLQNPLILVFIAVVLVFLALSMFGLYEIRIPMALTGKMGARKGLVGSLFMGLVVGIVAAPCIGPIIAGLILFVANLGNPVVGFWIFFTLAVGLGTPSVFLATISGSVNKLPRSGDWMIWIKKLFGLVLIGMAFFFLRVLFPEELYRTIMSLFILGSGIYLGFFERSAKASAAFSRAKVAVGSLLIVTAVGYFFWGERMKGAGRIDWLAYDVKLVEEATDLGKPVIIDFTAAWCIPCRELDLRTFTNEAVASEAERFLRLKVDLTSEEKNQDIAKLYNVVGVPTLVFLNSAGEEEKAHRVLTYMPPAKFLERMRKVR